MSDLKSNIWQSSDFWLLGFTTHHDNIRSAAYIAPDWGLWPSPQGGGSFEAPSKIDLKFFSKRGFQIKESVNNKRKINYIYTATCSFSLYFSTGFIALSLLLQHYKKLLKLLLYISFKVEITSLHPPSHTHLTNIF